MQVQDLGGRVGFADQDSCGMQQVGLTQSGSAIKQQGVVSATRLLGNLLGSSISQLIGLTTDKVVEAVTIIQAGLCNRA